MAGFIEFNSSQNGPAKIDYSLPLPGEITGKRIVQLDLNLDPNNDFLPMVQTMGESYREAAGITFNGNNISVNGEKAKRFLRPRLLKMGHNSAEVEEALSFLPKLLKNEVGEDDVMLLRRNSRTASRFPRGGDNVQPPKPLPDPPTGPIIGHPIDYVDRFVKASNEGVVAVPGTDSTGNGTTDEIVEEQTRNPYLFLIEVYGISSFLGDYGIGKTVKTFTLLPGESTTIKLRTWQSTKESIKESSSIIDSHEQSAKKRFSEKMQEETTDKSTESSTENWSVQADAKASWGWGSAKVSASASGEYQSGREQFAKTATESVGEHAKESSSKRELSVTSSSESETEVGQELTSERVIENVNMRRVLNFVFRELNQKYITRLHLKDIKVGFTNTFDNTWREVPISGLRTLLSEVLVPQKIEEASKAILKVAGTVFNNDDIPVRVLDKITYDVVNDNSNINNVSLDQNGEYEAPTETIYYRFKKGPLDQDNQSNQVDGVLLSEQDIVMRTDSVIVEALLGESDALDNYSMEIQEATARQETLRNEREQLIHNILNSVADPVQRAELAALIFNGKKTENDQ